MVVSIRSGKRCRGANALWNALSGSECAVEDAVGNNAMSRYIGTLKPGDVSDVVGPKKWGSVQIDF